MLSHLPRSLVLAALLVVVIGSRVPAGHRVATASAALDVAGAARTICAEGAISTTLHSNSVPCGGLIRLADPRAGDTFGPWQLVELLGGGGNGVVWKAQAGNRVGAIKIVRRRPDSEPFRRFRREVETHRNLSKEGFSGILKVLDTFTAEDKDAGPPGWLVTEIAKPMMEALDGADIKERVRAIAEVAETLGRLHSRNISHRDIKPDNLFSVNGRWTIGDFGLVDVEDSAPITEAGRALGPRHYQAPEMLYNPDTADGRKADIYSLAKTLWVLLTGQIFPIPGAHSHSEPLTRASTWSGPAVNKLDLLMERSTSINPDLRPSADEFSRELYTWLRPDPSEDDVDNSDYRDIAKGLLNSMRQGEDLQAASDLRNEQRAELSARMGKIIGALVEKLQRDGIPIDRVKDDGGLAQILLKDWSIRTEHGLPADVYFEMKHVIPGTSRLLGGQEKIAWLRSGFAFRTISDGDVVIGAGHVVGATGKGVITVWTYNYKFRLGSARADEFCDGIGETLKSKMLEALQKYQNMVESLTEI